MCPVMSYIPGVHKLAEQNLCESPNSIMEKTFRLDFMSGMGRGT